MIKTAGVAGDDLITDLVNQIIVERRNYFSRIES